MDIAIFCERSDCIFYFGEECQRTAISLDEEGKCRCYEPRKEESK